jgi:alpha-amylase/alpha-mannosidase (GH57 family)
MKRILGCLLALPVALLVPAFADDAGEKGPLYLNLIWYHHQPFVVDPTKDQLLAPSVRAHGTKDLYDMAAALEQYPNIHVSAILTSPLLLQLQSYYVDRLGPFVDPVANTVDATAFLEKWSGRTDPWIDIALMKTEYFLDRENKRLLEGNGSAFDLPDALLGRFPELAALKKKGGGYTVDEKRAIKAWHYLAWFDPDFLRGPVALPDGWVVDLSDLVSEKSDGTFRLRGAIREETANRLVAETYKVLASIVPIHRRLLYDPARREGRIELLTTPYHHPILPLLSDSDIARVSSPESPMPERFLHPEDAGAQVAKAVRLYEDLFGMTPRGMWPSEGAVSRAIVPRLAERGIRWTATSDRILSRSTPAESPLWRPYCVRDAEAPESGSVAVVFGNTDLADRIETAYPQLFGEEAADDFIREALRFAPEPGGEDRLLTVILDGDGAWEHYVRDNDGKDFRNALYRKLSELYDERRIVTVTTSEYIDGNPGRSVPAHPISEMAALETLWPGGAADGTFSSWIGEPGRNAGWNLLSRTRGFLAASGKAAPDPTAPPLASGDRGYNAALAWEEMYAAEGSDWFRWYGADETAPGGDEPFDAGFRMHITNVRRFISAGDTTEVSPLLTPSIPPLPMGGTTSTQPVWPTGHKEPVVEAGGEVAPAGAPAQVEVLFTCDATAVEVPEAIYITGNRPALANGVPNQVRMFDDGTNGDETAGDGIWSIRLSFVEGGHIEYKYTNSGARREWGPSEEFTGATRPLDVRLPAGEERLVVRDRFAVR